MEKSEPIQDWDIIDGGSLIVRLTFGLNSHMSWPFLSVPLPSSLGGAVIRTRLRSSPSVQTSMVMVRSQLGRWMVISAVPVDAFPR